MNSHNASTLQRAAAPIFNDVEALGAVKIVSKTRETMFLMTRDQVEKIIFSKEQRRLFVSYCQEDSPAL